MPTSLGSGGRLGGQIDGAGLEPVVELDPKRVDGGALWRAEGSVIGKADLGEVVDQVLLDALEALGEVFGCVARHDREILGPHGRDAAEAAGHGDAGGCRERGLKLEKRIIWSRESRGVSHMWDRGRFTREWREWCNLG